MLLWDVSIGIVTGVIAGLIVERLMGRAAAVSPTLGRFHA